MERKIKTSENRRKINAKINQVASEQINDIAVNINIVRQMKIET